MIALLVLALLQDPAPAQPPAQEPAPELPPAQEPEVPEEGGVTLEEISAAMEQVSTRMAEVNSALRDAMRGADRGDAPPKAADLGKAVDDARALVEDMEKLLALIPEPPPPPPDSGGGGGQSPQPQQGNQPAPDRPQGEQPRDGEDGDREESQQGSGELPPDAPMSSLLQMPREGEWGNLPPRLQQSIDAASAADVPLRYRRWLVEYHRRAAGE